MAILNTIYFQTVVIVMFIGSLFAVAIGIGLVMRPARMAHFFEIMSRWVSTRSVMKPAEVPRDIEPALLKWRRYIGAAFVLGGAFAIIGLLRYDVVAILTLFGDQAPTVSTLIIADTVKWLMVIGNLCGIAVGVLMIFYPHTLTKLNAMANQWCSVRQHTRNMDEMHLHVDDLVMAYPKVSGYAIALLGFFGAAGLGMFMLGKYWQ